MVPVSDRFEKSAHKREIQAQTPNTTGLAILVYKPFFLDLNWSDICGSGRFC
jgi:hypothetical protein